MRPADGYSGVMDRHHGAAAIRRWAARELESQSFSVEVESLGSQQTWPREINYDVTSNSRWWYFRVVLRDEDLSDEDFRTALAGSRDETRVQRACEHLMRRASETRRSAVW
ncbi:MAG: hypothetical protein M3540_12855 [Actinomycetota bacterium]|nr:hypothetical protein [Actinomycetota bacterium]